MVTPDYGKQRDKRGNHMVRYKLLSRPYVCFGTKFMHACYAILNLSIYIYIKADHARTNDESMS